MNLWVIKGPLNKINELVNLVNLGALHHIARAHVIGCLANLCFYLHVILIFKVHQVHQVIEK